MVSGSCYLLVARFSRDEVPLGLFDSEEACRAKAKELSYSEAVAFAGLVSDQADLHLYELQGLAMMEFDDGVPRGKYKYLVDGEKLYEAELSEKTAAEEDCSKQLRGEFEAWFAG